MHFIYVQNRCSTLYFYFALNSLLPKKQQRGNRMPKIDTVVQDLMKEVIEKYYHNIKQLSVKAVYSLLIEECRKKRT